MNAGEGGYMIKKLLIVEDEKMIRQGIQAMVMRSQVLVEEIILCKNGEEAYNVVCNQPIDVMITDIRMPKKDGITLVKEIQGLPHVPKVVVISGYDDFSYAVELMRYGVREYILKPVERDSIHDILYKLNLELEKEENNLTDYKRIAHQQLKYILLQDNLKESDIEQSLRSIGTDVVPDAYYVGCTNCEDFISSEQIKVLWLDDIHGQNIFIVAEENKELLLKEGLQNYCVGLSQVYSESRKIKRAYEEAIFARKMAFAGDIHYFQYQMEQYPYEKVKTVYLDENIEQELAQFVQLIGTNKCEKVNKHIAHLVYRLKQGEIGPDFFRSYMGRMVDQICDVYKNVLDIRNEKELYVKNIYKFNTVGDYYEVLLGWINEINQKLSSEYEDYKNKQKIQKAIQYVCLNYHRDLNMATVSNEISMNYSLFSYLFKQYTGMNFVNYLKKLRITEAKRLLEASDLKIFEISNQIGYENEKHFMKVFRGVCGVSPSEYRKNMQVGKR